MSSRVRRSLPALLIVLSTSTVMACSDAAPPNGNEPSADELSLFPAKRFDPKPGAYVGATFRLDLMQRGGELLANVSTRGDKYEGSSAVDLRVTFFNA